MARLSVLFIGLVVVLAAAPSWGLMVTGAGSPVTADAEGYLAAGYGGVSVLPGLLPSGGGTTFIVPVIPTATPPPDMTPIPPTPPPGPTVPEPGTIALVGMGILGIAAATRRRRS